MEPYPDFAQLRRHEREGIDYIILHRAGSSGLLVMAPHGGGIEPGTCAIADAVAGRRHAFYCFKGIKPRGNSVLHITSDRFDEPLAGGMLRQAQWVLAIHGCRDEEPVVAIGGLDERRGTAVITALERAGIPARPSKRPGLGGRQPENVCNRGRSAAGVQLEISRGLRMRLFSDLDRRALRTRVPRFQHFVAALKECLAEIEAVP